MRELKFDANLGFQQEAIQAITDIFAGQKVCHEQLHRPQDGLGRKPA